MQKYENKFYYIYNMQQNDFLIKAGAKPIGAGTGGKGDSYILYKKDEDTQRAMIKWAEFQAKQIV